MKLDTVHSVIATAVVALEGQAADYDPDVAHCLMRCALDPISEQAERLGAVARGTGKKVKPAG